MLETELTIVANKYATDKGTKRNLNYGNSHGDQYHHGFTQFYDTYFQKFKTRKPVILEIGVAEGGSIDMYEDFYHGNCEIHAADIIDKAELLSRWSNVLFHQFDQSNMDNIMSFVDYFRKYDIKFDIIIDDGSHIWDHQMMTLYGFKDMLKPDGIYIMEDIHTSYWAGFNSGSEDTSPIDFLTKFIPCNCLTTDQNKELMDSIDTVTLYNSRIFDETNSYETDIEKMKFDRSMTSVITFRN